MDSTSYEALRHAITQQRAQLALLSLDDPQLYPIYRNLIWCYHEAFARLYEQIAVRRQKAAG